MPRIVPFSVIAAMFLCLILGNSTRPSECPVHHSLIRAERIPIEYAEKVFSPEESAVLRENPYTGFAFGGDGSTIFRLHTTKVAICSQCRSNYLVATSLSKFYAATPSESSALQANFTPPAEDSGSADGPLFRNTQ
jgi:hypothetical protein